MSLLEVENVTLRFGGVVAVDKVSFNVEEGEVFALVGPNGAGKSTLFNLISRFYDPVEGDIRFAGESILKRAPHERAADVEELADIDFGKLRSGRQPALDDGVAQRVANLAAAAVDAVIRGKGELCRHGVHGPFRRHVTVVREGRKRLFCLQNLQAIVYNFCTKLVTKAQFVCSAIIACFCGFVDFSRNRNRLACHPRTGTLPA